MKQGSRVLWVDGEPGVWTPLRLLRRKHLANGDEIDAAFKVLLLASAPVEGMRPCDLLRKIPSFLPDQPWNIRLARFTTNLNRAAQKGRLVKVGHRYATPPIRKVELDANTSVRFAANNAGMSACRWGFDIDWDDWAQHFAEHVASAKGLVAAGLMAMSGWWLKPVHLDSLIDHHHHLFG